MPTTADGFDTWLQSALESQLPIQPVDNRRRPLGVVADVIMPHLCGLGLRDGRCLLLRAAKYTRFFVLGRMEKSLHLLSLCGFPHLRNGLWHGPCASCHV